MAWLLPVCAFTFGGGQGERHAMQGHAALWVLLLGFGAGLAWQLVDRRDLADRLVVYVIAVALTSLWLLLMPTGYAFANAGPAHALGGILAGLVVAEQALRIRARTRCEVVLHTGADRR
jgi:hypothetical protein